MCPTSSGAQMGKTRAKLECCVFYSLQFGAGFEATAHFTIRLITWGGKVQVADFSRTTSHCLT